MICKVMEAAETSWYLLVLSAISTEFIVDSLGDSSSHVSINLYDG
jgi:hypothetical protein